MVKPTISSSWYRDWIFGLLLLGVTLFAYHPVWNGKPLWDDEVHITKPELRSMDGLWRIWTHPGVTPQYYPLVHTVFWLAYHGWGGSPFGYHLLNILLHIFSALLLVKILRFLQVPGAWLAAGIFALHPVQVESVAWISELKNTLSGVFFLSTALVYLMFDRERKKRLYAVAMGLFILGLLSKTAIVPFPLAMLAVVWWKQGTLSLRRDVAPLIPFLLAGISLGLITLHIEHNLIGTAVWTYGFSYIDRCLIAGRAIWFYLSKLFWPINLIILYPQWSVNARVWWQYLFPGAVLLAGGVAWAVRGRWRGPAAVFFYFTAMLLPVIGFLNTSGFRFTFVADHFQYLAAIGPIAMGAGLVYQILGSIKGSDRFLKPVVVGILLSALGLLTWKQNGMYTDAETLYRTVIQKNPCCWMFHNNLGMILAKTGRTDEAVAHYRKAVEINPNYATAHNNLGNRLADIGQTDEAIVHYRRAVEINPNFDEAHYNLGVLLSKNGRTDEAMAHYQRALEITPNDISTLNNLAGVFVQKRQLNDAILCLQRALALAKSSGDESLAKEIAVNLERLNQLSRLSRAK